MAQGDGWTVGRIVPAGQPLDGRLQAMVVAGPAEWYGKPRRAVRTAARVNACHSIAALVIEDADERLPGIQGTGGLRARRGGQEESSAARRRFVCNDDTLCS